MYLLIFLLLIFTQLESKNDKVGQQLTLFNLDMSASKEYFSVIVQIHAF